MQCGIELLQEQPWEEEFPGGGEGVLWLIAECVPLASQSPCPIIVYSVTKYRPHVSHGFSASMLFFGDPDLATFYFCELAYSIF